MRSSAGVGMTPPKVEGAAKPTSSVMMRRMFGAPFGGTTRAGQAGVDWAALSSIWPWNRCGGGGSTWPSIVVVALGAPAAPVVWGTSIGGAPICGVPDISCALATPSETRAAAPRPVNSPAIQRQFDGAG